MQSGTNVSLKHTAFTTRSSSILKMEAAHASETSHIPEDSNTRGHHCENFKSHICQGFSFITLFTINAVVE